MEHWLEREIAQWVHPMKDDPTTHRTLSERSYHRSEKCIAGCNLFSIASQFATQISSHCWYLKYLNSTHKTAIIVN